jgi:hypothetical protein
VAAFKGGFGHNRMSLENNPVIVSLQREQVTVLLTSLLKKASLFMIGNL